MKQQLFLKEYVKTKGNGTQAALRVYDTKDPVTAAHIATENVRKPEIQEELKQILKGDKYNINNFTNKLASIATEEPVKGYAGTDIIKANELMLKLHGVLLDKRQVTSLNINADLSSMSEHELIQLRNKKKQETDAIINEQ